MVVERAKILLQYFQGTQTQSEVAKENGVSTRAFAMWLADFRRDGVSGLRSSDLGAKSKLPRSQADKFSECVENLNTELGRTPTLAEVNDMLEKEFGIRYANPTGVRRLLKRIGFDRVLIRSR